MLAPDVAAGIDAWTSGPQLLVGQSLGGLTAAAVAASRPDLVRELVVIDITPGVDPNAGPTQIREFFAGPTDWATRDEMVDRALSLRSGRIPRRAAERGVYFNSRDAAGRTLRVEASLRAPAGGDVARRRRAGRGRRRGSRAADGVSHVLSADRLGRPGGRDRTAHAHPRRARLRHGGGCRRVRGSACPRHPSTVVPTGHNVQEEQPGGISARACANWRGRLTLVLRSE